MVLDHPYIGKKEKGHVTLMQYVPNNKCQQCFESTSFFNKNSYTMVPKNEKSGTKIKSKYLIFLTEVGGWSGKGQKHPYVI